MTDRTPQLGEVLRTRLGGNLTESFAIMQNIRAQIEAIQETARVQAILEQHADGKISPLAVQYMDIVKCPEILDYVTPISREPDVDGKVILWEGYQRKGGDMSSGMRGDRGQLHRVVQHANGRRVFCRWNNRDGAWVICEGRDKKGNKIPNFFPPLGFARAKNEDWADVGTNTVSRTVMTPKGDTVTRTFQSWTPKHLRR
jgi:hypothetical protein